MKYLTVFGRINSVTTFIFLLKIPGLLSLRFYPFLPTTVTHTDMGMKQQQQLENQAKKKAQTYLFSLLKTQGFPVAQLV